MGSTPTLARRDIPLDWDPCTETTRTTDHGRRPTSSTRKDDPIATTVPASCVTSVLDGDQNPQGATS